MRMLPVLLSLFIVACSIQKSEKPEIDWKLNNDGIRYFVTCIEGYSFISTSTAGGRLAGPVGRCVID